MANPDTQNRPRIDGSALRMLAVTACIVAVADGLAAVLITFLQYDRPPVFVFQYIATGLLGPSAFSGGVLAGSLGLLFHFLIATAWTTLLFFAHRSLTQRLPNVFLKAVTYGLIIWFVMNLFVLPLSRVPGGLPGIRQVIIGIAALILAAGWPMAHRFDRYYLRRRLTPRPWPLAAGDSGIERSSRKM